MRPRAVAVLCLGLALIPAPGDPAAEAGPAPAIVIDGEVKALPSATAGEAPVAGAQVWAFLQGPAPGAARPGSTRKKTDEQGKFRFALAPGRYTIVIHGGLTREFIPSAHHGLGDRSTVNTLLTRTIDEHNPKPVPVALTRANLEGVRKVIPVDSPEPNEVKEYKKFLDGWISDLDAVLGKPVNVLVPAYFNPADRPDDWKKIARAAEQYKGKLQLVVILNPASGPGTAPDASYGPALRECTKAGARVIGYLALGFGKAPQAELRKGVDSYRKWYPQIDGFFLDELDDGAAATQVVRDVAAYARNVLKPPKGSSRRPALIVGNPGKAIAAGPLVKDRVLDHICVYENDEKPVRFVPPDWAAGENGQKVCALVYDLAGEAEMRRVTRGLLGAGVTMLFVTDGSRVNPDVRFGLQWGRLPKYWDAFLDAAASR